MTLRSALCLVVFPPLLAVFLALMAWTTAAQQYARADGAAARLQAALDSRPDEPAVQAARLLVPGSTAGLALSALQAQVLNLLGKTIQVQQIDARAVETEGPLTRLSVKLRLAGDEASVMKALIAIEWAEPLIFVDALLITASGPSLSVEIELLAYAGKIAT